MVQILPYVPGFGEQLAQSLGQATSQIGQGLVKGIEGLQAKRHEAVLSDPNSTPVQKVNAFMNLPESLKKSSAPLWAAILGPQAEADTSLKQFNELFGGNSPQPNAQNVPQNQPIQGQNAPNLEPKPAISPQESPNVANEPRSGVLDPKDMTKWPDEQLSKVSAFSGSKGAVGVVGKSAQNEIDRREKDRKKFVDERNFHEKGASKAEEKAAGLRDSLPKKEMALTMARDAIATGEVGGFSINNLAERLNIPELKTAKGAQLITASKEALLGNLAKISAKAQNQWMEQRLNSMFPSIGQTQEANETILTMLDAETKMDKAYLEAFNEISDNDIKEHGYVKNDIDKRASELANSKNDAILNETSYKLRQAYEKEKGALGVEKEIGKKVPKGTPLTLEAARIMLKKNKNDFDVTERNAEKLGYRIPSPQEIRQWHQSQ